LEPETITFAGKEKLYRKEGKERPVIFGTWMRISAAAVIMGLVAITWIFTQNNLKSAGNHSVASSPQTVKTPTEEVKQPVTKETVAALHEKPAVKVATETGANPVKKHEVKIANEGIAASTIKNTPNEVVAGINKKTELVKTVAPTPKPSVEAIASTRTTNKNNLPMVNDDRINGTVITKYVEETGTSLATQAAYREIDNQEDDEERSFYIGSAEINKNKLKGLFKKAASLIGKKTNKSDGERTLKIAGFEIKSK
jgi:hypothetical protein